MNAAWAQAWLSGLAIVVSGAFAVLVPFLERRERQERENRNRLAVTTTRFAPAGLTVDLSYQPEFTHIGLFARVNLLGPAGAVLKQLRFAKELTPTGDERQFQEMGGQFVDRVGTVRLVRLDNETGFSGSMLILPPLQPTTILTSARIRVEVLTDAEERLLRVSLHVTPIDETRSFWES